MTKVLSISFLSLALAAGAGCVSLGFRAADYHPQINPADFRATVDNPYMPLVPGMVFKYIETAGRDTFEVVTTVTRDTKTIMGVQCVVVHDVQTKSGVVTEDTYDWYAQDKEGTVWYFGEATREFKANGTVDPAGSWEAGVRGALPGIIMPGTPKPGDPYRQEYARGEAEDMGQIVALDETVTVPAGSYTGCVKTKDWSMLESGSENKWYARGVGLVKAESSAGEVMTLMSITRN